MFTIFRRDVSVRFPATACRRLEMSWPPESAQKWTDFDQKKHRTHETLYEDMALSENILYPPKNSIASLFQKIMINHWIHWMTLDVAFRPFSQRKKIQGPPAQLALQQLCVVAKPLPGRFFGVWFTASPGRSTLWLCQ